MRQRDSRRLLPGIVIALFMAVTISHVAAYVGQFEPAGMEWVGWPYAIAVDLSIVVCSFFTKWATTKRWAWSGYFVFVLASGMMNAAHVEPWARSDWWAAWIFALFPTVAIALAGFLYRQVDSLAGSSERRKARKTEKADAVTAKESEPVTQSSEQRSQPCVCWCGKRFATPQALSAHARLHRNEVARSESAGEALRTLRALYPAAYETGGANGKEPPKHPELIKWLEEAKK